MKATLQLNQSVQRAVNGINRYADSWRRHQSLWKTDKGSVLDKFKSKDPPNAAFEEKLSKYSKVYYWDLNWGASRCLVQVQVPKMDGPLREKQSEAS